MTAKGVGQCSESIRSSGCQICHICSTTPACTHLPYWRWCGSQTACLQIHQSLRTRQRNHHPLLRCDPCQSWRNHLQNLRKEDNEQAITKCQERIETHNFNTWRTLHSEATPTSMMLLLLMMALLKEVTKRVIKEVIEVIEHIMEIKVSMMVKCTVSTTGPKEGIKIEWRSLLSRSFCSKHIVLSSLVCIW